jgi:hypothetical protein
MQHAAGLGVDSECAVNIYDIDRLCNMLLNMFVVCCDAEDWNFQGQKHTIYQGQHKGRT